MKGEILNEPKDYSRKKSSVCVGEGIKKNNSIKISLPNDFKEEFNSFWGNFFKEKRNYYDEIPFKELVSLKSVVSKINNLITYEATKFTADLVGDILDLSKDEIVEIKNNIENTSVNANGYDIEYSGNIKFICEVKASIPISGEAAFGAKQNEAIEKDIKSLLHGKVKSTIPESKLVDYYKFMSLYSVGDNSVNAVHTLINKLNKNFGDMIELWHGQEVEQNKVYLILVTEN